MELGSSRQDRSDMLCVVLSLGERLDPFFLWNNLGKISEILNGEETRVNTM